MTLQQLVAAERERQGLSLRDVADRSDGALVPTTVNQIERGLRTSVTDKTLDGLALALELPIDKVRRAAGVRRPDTDEPFALPKKANRLTRKERQVVLDMVDALLEAKRRG